MARGFRGGERRAAAVDGLIERDGARCWYCGCTFGAGDRRCTIDHVLPVSQGGKNNLGNLRLACTYCNARRARFPDGVYETSRLLARRRHSAHRDAMLASGEWLPKQAFHHQGIRWRGEKQWDCDDCGQGSQDGSPSPATVPCAPWSSRPRSSWILWWHDPSPIAEPEHVDAAR